MNYLVDTTDELRDEYQVPLGPEFKFYLDSLLGTWYMVLCTISTTSTFFDLCSKFNISFTLVFRISPARRGGYFVLRTIIPTSYNRLLFVMENKL